MFSLMERKTLIKFKDQNKIYDILILFQFSLLYSVFEISDLGIKWQKTQIESQKYLSL